MKLINIWSGRYLTPFGKIIIIKSLLISKITHVLLSLPTPKKSTFEKIETCLKQFCGMGNKLNSEKKLECPTNHGGGGLNFTNLEIFDASLKLSWLRRVQQQSMVWADFPHNFNIHKLVPYGDIRDGDRWEFYGSVRFSVLLLRFGFITVS